MKAVLLRTMFKSSRLRINPTALFGDPIRYEPTRWYSSDDESNKSSKDKLHDLLKSMVEDSKERKARGETPQIDFKLAVHKRTNPNKKPITVKTSEASKKPESPPSSVTEEPELSPQLLSAVKSVAATLNNSETIENELVQKLKTQQTEKVNLSELFLGMKIDRSPTRLDQPPIPQQPQAQVLEGSRAQRVRQIFNEDNQRPQSERYTDAHLESRLRPRPTKNYGPISLFGARPIGIFTSKKPTTIDPPITPTLTTWDTIHQKELKLSTTHPPANGFEEMILWTEQGKFWHFPIDNEQGNDENSKYDFTDHVFLTPVIDPWCPKTGPIRQFMELVTVALSKNPYLSVPEKHEYLTWYQEYFKEKADIIKKVGAGEIG